MRPNDLSRIKIRALNFAAVDSTLCPRIIWNVRGIYYELAMRGGAKLHGGSFDLTFMAKYSFLNYNNQNWKTSQFFWIDFISELFLRWNTYVSVFLKEQKLKWFFEDSPSEKQWLSWKKNKMRFSYFSKFEVVLKRQCRKSLNRFSLIRCLLVLKEGFLHKNTESKERQNLVRKVRSVLWWYHDRH